MGKLEPLTPVGVGHPWPADPESTALSSRLGQGIGGVLVLAGAAITPLATGGERTGAGPGCACTVCVYGVSSLALFSSRLAPI